MEGVLRGLGKHNFSSVNYLAEYIVRISVLLICVPMFGFYGIAASYLACNLSGNAVRLFFVIRMTGLKPVWKRILLRPAIALFGAWQIMLLISKICIMLRFSAYAVMAVCAVISGLCYAAMLYLMNRKNRQFSITKSCTGLSV